LTRRQRVLSKDLAACFKKTFPAPVLFKSATG
jgi:hypothetical protein